MDVNLTDKEQLALDKFFEELPEKLRYKKVKLIFSRGSGIGRCVYVKVGKLKKDITDYQLW